MKATAIFLCALAAASLGAAAQAQDLKKADGVLVNGSGMTVYTFDKDSPGKSACSGPCIQNWPAVPAPDKVAEPYSVITRDDGSKQLAYKGKPLYLYVADKKPGDRAGDNFKDVWHVVKD